MLYTSKMAVVTAAYNSHPAYYRNTLEFMYYLTFH